MSAAPETRGGGPLLDEEISALRRWRRLMRLGLVLALALLVGWVLISSRVEDSLVVQLLGGLFGLGIVAWGFVVMFGGRCPRCGLRLVPRPALRIPEQCPRCGTGFSAAA